MSTPAQPSPVSSILSSIGNALIPPDVQNQLTVAENQLTTAIEVSIALQAIIAVELFVLIVLTLKK
jgi:hypothetical protein